MFKNTIFMNTHSSYTARIWDFIKESCVCQEIKLTEFCGEEAVSLALIVPG